jgi:DNA-binding transcriptional LysR family regulator
MELRQLEYFQMASRLNNLTRAAERLHVSQPNITVAIQKLETELGTSLFDRTQKQLALTPEGQLFLRRVDNALRELKDAVIEIDDYKQMQKGRIQLGIPPMIGSYLFPRIFYGFQKLHPKLELSIVEEGSLAIHDKLDLGELDIGIVILANAPSSLNVLPLTRHQILVCLPPDHPLAKNTAIDIRDLRDEPLILLKEDSYHRRIILSEFDRHQFTPHIRLSSNQLNTIKSLVANGMGISFLLDVMTEKESALVGKPLTQPVYVEIGLAWKKDRYLSLASRAFIEFITSYSNK